MPDLPVACGLSDPELRARRGGMLAEFRRACLEQRWLGNGLALRFAAEPGRLAFLSELLELERQCCRFLTFGLEVAPDGGPIWLTLTGPEGTAEFLAHELGFGGWQAEGGAGVEGA
jgi:hypothetical protein